MTTANMATGGAAMAGKAIMGATAETMGGASAIQAAFQKASAGISNGSDMPSMEPKETRQSGQFDGNSLGGTPSNDEATSSANDDTNNNESRS